MQNRRGVDRAPLRVFRKIARLTTKTHREAMLPTEARHSVLDVGGVARPAHFAVADHIDAAVDLVTDCLQNDAPNLLSESSSVLEECLLALADQINQAIRPGEATNVCRENAVFAGQQFVFLG
jgi:hypothetical protein